MINGMSTDKVLKKNIVVVQTRSFSGLTKVQKANLLGLGLSGIGSKSNLVCSDSILGMIKRVNHLVKVSTN